MHTLKRLLIPALLAAALMPLHQVQASPDVAIDQTVGITAVTTEQVFDLAQQHSNLHVLDVRFRFEYNRGHLPDAISLPSNEASAEKFQRLIPDKQTTLMVYCGSERCSESWKVARLAIALGYKNVFWYRDGIKTWVNEGFVAERENNWGSTSNCS